MFLSVMIAIGLFAFRIAIARPMVRRVTGTNLRAISIAFVVASVLGVVAIPVYLDFATANDSLRSVFDITALVPLFRVTAFGRGYVDMTLCFALFCLAAWITLWLDRPERAGRSIAAIVSLTGAVARGRGDADASPARPGTRRSSPRAGSRCCSTGCTSSPDRCGSAGWSGCSCCGLRVGSDRARRGLCPPSCRGSPTSRSSRCSCCSEPGTGATIFHMPAINALWETGYGVAILVKIGILTAAVIIASGNLLRTKPRLVAAREQPELGLPAARLLRALSAPRRYWSPAPCSSPRCSRASRRRRRPSRFRTRRSLESDPAGSPQTIKRGNYVLQVLVSPNKAAAPDSFALRITQNGQPVRGANVTLTFNHLEMQMPQQEYQLTETQPGVYARAAPALVMVGKWGLSFQVTPKSGPPFTALIVDQANG